MGVDRALEVGEATAIGSDSDTNETGEVRDLSGLAVCVTSKSRDREMARNSIRDRL
jgi:hypothetical protein